MRLQSILFARIYFDCRAVGACSIPVHIISLSPGVTWLRAPSGPPSPPVGYQGSMGSIIISNGTPRRCDYTALRHVGLDTGHFGWIWPRRKEKCALSMFQ